jgi:FkbM family methyltransferase
LQKFGTFAPRGFSRIILGLAKIGLGRGRLKLLFSQLWNRTNGDKPVDLIYQNLKLRLQPRQNTIESKIMFSAKKREGAELALIKRHLVGGGVFVDIGSNIGYYALNVALMNAGKVIAIEPNPTVLARLRDNIALNDLQSKIIVHDVAIGADKDIAQLTLSDNDFGSSSIVNQRVGKTHIDVEVVPLVEILKINEIANADVIKIDIEGMEDRALFPYFENIAKEKYPKLIVMEDGINEQWERDILGWLLANGYHAVERTRGNIVLERHS